MLSPDDQTEGIVLLVLLAVVLVIKIIRQDPED